MPIGKVAPKNKIMDTPKNNQAYKDIASKIILASKEHFSGLSAIEIKRVMQAVKDELLLGAKVYL